MKNPAYNGDGIYLARIGSKLHVIPVSFSRNRVATAWRGFSDETLARAGGYGYDKESDALSKAVARLIREQYTGNIPPAAELVAHAIEQTGGTGVDTVMRVAGQNGIELVNVYHYAIKRFVE